MSEFCRKPQCAHPGAVVLIEAVPLCQLDPLDAAALAALIEDGERDAGSGREGLPVRCAALMSCSQAAALAKEVGHVAF